MTQMLRSMAGPVKTETLAPELADPSGLLAMLPLPVALLSADGLFIAANPATEDFFETGFALLRRLRVADLVPPGHPLVTTLDEVARTRRTCNEYGVEIVLPRSGVRRLVDVLATPMRSPSGDVLLTLAPRNVPAMIERQLSHRSATRSIAGMASVLAHEIKNPLSGIRGAAQLLETGADEQGRELTRLICAETDRICRLVDRMEDFGDARPITKTDVNIHSVLDHVRRIAEQGFARGIRIAERYDPSLPPVPGNADRLIQALLNLVKNAAEAIGPGRTDGRIVLSTAYRTGLRHAPRGQGRGASLPLVVAIEDNGPGVPEDLRHHLFEPFVSSKPMGRGLGLALVAKVVEEHGGLIELDQQPQRTIFRVALPVVADHEQD